MNLLPSTQDKDLPTNNAIGLPSFVHNGTVTVVVSHVTSDNPFTIFIILSSIRINYYFQYYNISFDLHIFTKENRVAYNATLVLIYVLLNE